LPIIRHRTITPVRGDVTFAPGSGSTVLKSVHAGVHDRVPGENGPVRGLPTSVDAEARDAMSKPEATALRETANIQRFIDPLR
jgi:hypothetical protein